MKIARSAEVSLSPKGYFLISSPLHDSEVALTIEEAQSVLLLLPQVIKKAMEMESDK